MSDDNWDDDGIGDDGTYESYSDSENKYRDSRDQQFAAPPQQHGMSTGLKVVIGLLIAGGVVFLGCMGLVVYMGMQLADNFQFSDKPEDVRTMTESIVDIKIPEETFEPQASMKMDVIFFKMKMAVYGDENIKALVIAEGIGAGEIQEEMEKSMRESIEDQGQGDQIDVTKSEERTFTIKGEEVVFTFAEGTVPGSKEEVNQVTGGFKGKEGYAFIMMQIDSESYNEDEIVKMIESIK